MKSIQTNAKSGQQATVHNVPDQQEIITLVSLFNGRRYIEAELLAQSMTERFPSDGLGWQVLGAVFKRMGRNMDALAPLQKAAALSPGFPEPHYNLANTLKDLGRSVDAEASYRRALQIKPDYSEAHNNLGITLQDQGRIDEAEASYRQALQLNPNYAEAHYNLGVIMIDKGRLAEAEACYRRALEIKPDYAKAHNNLGNIFSRLGRDAEAETCFRRALEINPNSADTHNNLGNTLMDMGRLDEAEASFRQALRVNPSDAKAHLGLGNLFSITGNLDAVATHFNACLEIDPEDSYGVRLLLARVGLLQVPARASEAQLNRLYIERSKSWGLGTYRGHELVAHALKKLAPDNKLDILDAGCGTGLVGVLVRDLARTLDGIDMSAAMLEMAGQKGLYDRLHQGDLEAFMASHPNSFDAITSAATLIHFGDLATVFGAAASSLRNDGLFVFTLFQNDCAENGQEVVVARDRGFASGGCYAHSPDYVRRLAAATGFTVDMLDSEIHEYCKAKPVMALVVALRRQAKPDSSSEQ